MIKSRKYIFKNNDIYLIVKKDRAGWYLFVYKKNSDVLIYESLQDTKEDIFDEVLERYEIKESEFKKLDFDASK